MAEISIPEGACVLYWLYDENCVCPWRHGYVGVSTSFKTRIAAHRSNGVFPGGFKVKVLLIGSEEYCLLFEAKLRPEPLIGWNIVSGGKGVPNKGRKGQIKSEEERRKISVSNTGKIRTPEQRAAMGLLKIGNKNRLGKPFSEESKERIRIAVRGKIRHDEIFKMTLSKRMKGNSYTKGKPWSAARRLAWLAKNTPEIL